MNVETSCEACIFALWDTNKHPTEQVSCEFNRLDRFKSVGVKVEKKENNRYYTVGAHCNRCFQSDGSSHGGREERAKLAIEKSRITCDLIIAPHHEGELRNFISLFKSLTPQPNKLFVLDKYRLNERFAQVLMGESFRWQTLSGDNVNWDDAIDKTESEFFWLLNGPPVPLDILQKVDDAWNEKMLQFFCIEGEYGVLAHYDNYKMFVNQCDDIVNKFKGIDEKFNLSLGKRVYTWQEILESQL